MSTTTTTNTHYLIRPADPAQSQPVAKARGASMQILIGPEDQAPRYFTRMFTLQPGGRIPRHWHPDIEHEQFVVSGEMHMGLGEDERVVKTGDSIFIPARTPHWYENRGTEAVQFLCIVPRTEQYVTEWMEVLDP